jgi:hypothetical protein
MNDDRNRVSVALFVLCVTVFSGHSDLGPNILFFAAWPMLGACFALYYLRDHDTLWSLCGRRA